MPRREEVHHDTHDEYRYPTQDILHQMQAHRPLIERRPSTHTPGGVAINDKAKDRQEKHSPSVSIGWMQETLDRLLHYEDRSDDEDHRDQERP